MPLPRRGPRPWRGSRRRPRRDQGASLTVVRAALTVVRPAPDLLIGGAGDRGVLDVQFVAAQQGAAAQLIERDVDDAVAVRRAVAQFANHTAVDAIQGAVRRSYQTGQQEDLVHV